MQQTGHQKTVREAADTVSAQNERKVGLKSFCENSSKVNVLETKL